MLRDEVGAVQRVCGLDVHYAAQRALAFAAAAACHLPGLGLEQSALAARPIRFPYIPGLLSFREAPAALAALALLEAPIDLLLIDGHGWAHPRRFGIACHIGVLTGLPTIGVAKSRLIGQHEEPGPAFGDRTPLCDGREVIGMVVRTRPHAKPVYVSVGHRLSLERAVELVLMCCRGHRLPEPVRLADRLSRCHAA